MTQPLNQNKMTAKLKNASYFKYSLEWWLTECDEIWVLIEKKFEYNKKYNKQKVK